MVSVVVMEIKTRNPYPLNSRLVNICFFSYPLLFKNKFWKYKRYLLWLKSRNGKSLKFKYLQRGVKLKYSIEKNVILHTRLFSPTQPTKSYYWKVF